MIFVDSNVPMYLIGAPHPHKRDAERILDELLHARSRLVTDAEVLQELMHRYTAIQRRDAIQPAFDALLGVVDEVFPVDLKAVESARTLLLGAPQLSARDALHAAIMRQQGVLEIFTFDAGFDALPGIRRIH